MQYLRDLTLGRYVSRDSLLHSLDPRTKLICALLFMIAVFFISNIGGIVLFLLLVVSLYPLAKIPLRFLWGNIRVFLWLYAVTFFIHVFLHPGDALVRLPLLGWEVTAEGIAAGVLFTVRIAILVSLSALLMSVTMPQDLTDGIEKLLRPLERLKVPVSEGALMVSIALRFVPILMQEAVKIQRAQMARGADLEGGWMVRIKKSLPMILPLFSGALKKADDLALALEARAYRGGRGRTQLAVLRMTGRDLSALALATGITLGFAFLR